MKSPQYIRQSSSPSRCDSDVNQNQLTTNYDFLFKNNLQVSSLNDLNVTGLRQKKLLILVSWLVLLSVFSIVLISLNITLIRVLQITTHGMKSLKIHSYENKKTNRMESAVHFIADKIDLGHIVAKSGKIFGANGKTLIIEGSKIRAPINENLKVIAKNLNIRGNEAIYIDSKNFNNTANKSIHIKTSKDGAVRLKGHRIFFGDKWKPLEVSSSPALTASIDAYRVCICTSLVKPKIFIVNGNKLCKATSNICQ